LVWARSRGGGGETVGLPVTNITTGIGPA
jgi:hypothetical protein